MVLCCCNCSARSMSSGVGAVVDVGVCDSSVSGVAQVRDELLPVVHKLNEGKPKTAKKRARVQLDVVNLAIWVKTGCVFPCQLLEAVGARQTHDTQSQLDTFQRSSEGFCR
eukprot:3761770-Rhodomonas_salina.4